MSKSIYNYCFCSLASDGTYHVDFAHMRHNSDTKHGGFLKKQDKCSVFTHEFILLLYPSHSGTDIWAQNSSILGPPCQPEADQIEQHSKKKKACASAALLTRSHPTHTIVNKY